MTKRFLVCLMFLLLSAHPHVMQAQSPCRMRAAFSERLLRSRATKTVMPEFPADALTRKVKGIVVAQIVINEDGNVSEIEITKTPDPSLKQSVVDAVQQWKFQKHAVQGQPICITGSLTFKFAIDKGRGQVKDAPEKES